MKINKKLVIGISLAHLIIPLLALAFLLGSLSKSTKDIELQIPRNHEVYKNVNDRTEEIFRSLNKILFGDNEAEKIKYLNTQKEENSKEFIKKSNELKAKYLETKSEESIKELKEFYSKNLILLLRNLDKFNLRFTKYWTLEETRNSSGKVAKHSNEFLEAIKNKQPVKDKKIDNNNLNVITIGSESKHISSNVIYIRKDNFFIVIKASKTPSVDMKIELDKIIYFAESKTDNISSTAISNVLHSSIYHQDQSGYDAFEKDLIKLYGFPCLGLLIAEKDFLENIIKTKTGIKLDKDDKLKISKVVEAVNKANNLQLDASQLRVEFIEETKIKLLAKENSTKYIGSVEIEIVQPNENEKEN
ncbi:hypothetical protein NX779_00155 [Mycoplasma cottewii]|uniref:Uncharacterized protein n=1 Tax=Mycoplasma cottewii TaxID=51364 RepID=A0ABY5TWL6_9MOLU|nr:aromatic motif membrane protein [Mycoplasma cottewii]UWD35059.1 hypothetical protein NX779_00155 [Mycoplasma cottewii]